MNVMQLDAHLSELTPHQLKLVQAIYESEGDWLTRAKLARAIGKRRLTPYDIECLGALTELGIIVTDTRPTTAPGSEFAYIYNMTDIIADLLQEWSKMQEDKTRQRRRKPVKLV